MPIASSIAITMPLPQYWKIMVVMATASRCALWSIRSATHANRLVATGFEHSRARPACRLAIEHPRTSRTLAAPRRRPLTRDGAGSRFHPTVSGTFFVVCEHRAVHSHSIVAGGLLLTS